MPQVAKAPMAPVTTKISLRPLHDRLLVKRLEEGDEKHGSIIIPDSAKEKPQEGKVIAAGTGRVTEDGRSSPSLSRRGIASFSASTPAARSRSTARNASS